MIDVRPRPARRLPAVVAVASALLLAGCLEREVRRMLPLVPDFGVHVTSLRRGTSQVAYLVGSALPGRAAAMACRAMPATAKARPRITVIDCAGESASAVDRLVLGLHRASAQLEVRYPWIGIDQVTVRLLPKGVEHVELHRERTAPGALRVAMAFRTLAGGDVPLRFAVRAFVHETTHLAIQARMRVPIARQEYIARVAETCIEHAVFGHSRGYAHPQEIHDADVRPFGRAARLSILAGQRARADAGPLLTAIGAGSPDALARFGRFCDSVFALRPGP